MIKLLTDQWRILPNTAKKMKVLSMGNESIFVAHRKYLRLWFNFKGLNANF